MRKVTKDSEPVDFIKQVSVMGSGAWVGGMLGGPPGALIGAWVAGRIRRDVDGWPEKMVRDKSE